ncbi:autotransporter outer membrane beta-barrel domain-containing protein [Helicobacter mustelae]|uniref:Putative outer membrane autotransporter n=1 Tax=Helicobacter mustelae (strain ATCC 43772 / CCUG 25715 / CIP 103759 / LMG 18044 / NCTC 12198 / R85-136P) TaxID=679897 RepID=D3UFQ3_HELM1|nr:autotransporter outer membrane beta-barrel domain-containing protein [Helicobacter mustelae]CBG39324.1 putative outer membrane autotransporter [Helicobacter mustelae 12198]SQH70836.1 outer membrane autotransporter [Helicobacter mustelae]
MQKFSNYKKIFQPFITNTFVFSLASSFGNAADGASQITVTVDNPAAEKQTAAVSGSGGNATFLFTNGAGSLVQDGATSAGVGTATGTNIVVNIANTINTFSVTGKALTGGSGGVGSAGKPVNLTFDFGDISGSQKTLNLNIGSTGAGQANALTGNVNVIGGGGSNLQKGNAGTTFNANFDKAIVTGNITTRRGASGAGANHITFSNTGANQATVVLRGNILNFGGINNVSFDQGTMKGNIEARHLSNASPGYNQVQFLQDGVVYEGNITASGGENVLFFGRKESKTVGSSSSGGITPAASGNGTADNGKLQTIFTGNGDTFKGNLLAENGGKNTMTFYKNGKIEGSTGIVQITANNASNTIELRNGGSITNARILSQEGGKNSIGFSTSDGGASSASQTGGSTTPNSKFDAISSGNNSSTTILLQTPMTLDANITYGGHFAGNSYVYDGSNNTVTLFFANKRSEGTTAPSTTPSNNASQTRAASQISNTSPVNSTSSTTELAASFKDGISLQLQDKSINLDGKDGTYSTSFISTAMAHGLGANSTTPLHVHVIKSGDANNVNNSITLSGVAVGSVSALSSSDATNPAAINSTYTINLQNKSIFLGSFSKDLQNSHTKVNLVLEHNAKFIADSSTQLENLTIQAATFDKNDSATPTLLQNNTVVDVASGGGSNNITREGNTFYLLSIGKDPTNIAQATGGASSASQTGSTGGSTPTGSTTPNNALGANGLSGSNALFRVYVNTNANQGSNGSNNGSGAALNNQHSSNGSGLYGYIYSDRVIVHNVKNSASGNTITRSTGGSTSTATSITPLTEYLQILASGNVSSIKYHGGGTETKGNIGVATVRNDASGKALVDFKTIGTIVGFDALDTKLIAIKTDAYGKVKNNGLSGAGASGGTSGGGIHGNDYTTYFLQSGVSGTSRANQLASATALASNYYLYLANINSLNKRLGELRNNPHANGVWIRLFNGMQTTTFALQTKSIYTTLQGGYDYAFGSEGANDYLGFAISYANAGMDSLMRAQAFNHAQKGIKSSSGNAFEIALYNSYVQDGATRSTNFKNGLYSDSIIKLSFLANKIKLAGNNNTPSVNNFGFTFSQEIGYRFLLGENQEWYITPQGELTLGYLNQSNLKQVLGSHYLSGVQTSIFTLQGRIGSSFGYRFYQFTADKNYYPEIYLGLYGVGNYIGGGDITLISNLGSVNALRTLGSTGRFLFNLGTNFTIKDNHRVYFDFERSFGGRIIVDYQFNIGYRYSFGENKKYASLAGSISQTIKRDEKKQNKEEITE